MGIGALIAGLSTSTKVALASAAVATGATVASTVQAKKSAKAQERRANESQSRINQQQAEIKQQQADEETSRQQTEADAIKRRGSRLALISTSPQGVLSDTGDNGSPGIGRRKLLGN